MSDERTTSSSHMRTDASEPSRRPAHFTPVDSPASAATAAAERRLATDLLELGFTDVAAIHRNLPAAELVARSLARGEGILAANGALVVRTGEPTGRSPADRFIVERPPFTDAVDWGPINQPCSPQLFARLLTRARRHLRGREIYVFDGYAGAERTYRMPLRVVSDTVWHALFAQTLFVRPTAVDLQDAFVPEFTVIDCGALPANPEIDGTRSSVFVGIDFAQKLILILGTMYGGEIKKAVFTVMNYLLPERDVLPMHCSANVGANGDTALFFGLSGTGKTTLSADPSRRLIGDDEHGWSSHSVFNFEGGCYAKVIHLSPTDEPQIFAAIKFGSILENVIVDPLTRAIDYDSDALTENTRATYPVDHIPGAIVPGVGDHPRNVFFLTCDAYGVLPPIAKLTPEMASYHFLSGFTSKVAGTEAGVTDPQPTFSACFGAPFMPRSPVVYATMLAERLATHRVDCWLVNTGWTGGPHGIGQRIDIGVTRALLSAALESTLAATTFRPDPLFRILVPDEIPGLPTSLLHPRETWRDPAAYDTQARLLAAKFAENFVQYEPSVPPEVAAAGPRVE